MKHMFFRRITPLATILLIFGIFEALYLYPRFIFLELALLIAILTLAIIFILGKGLKTPWSIFYFLIAPLLFLSAIYFFVLFVPSNVFRHIIAAFGSLLVGLYLHQIFFYIWRHDRYIPFSLENVSGYLTICSLFFFGSSLFALKIFLQIPILTLLLLVFGFFFFIGWQMIWVNKFSFQETKLFVTLNTLVALEIFVALFFLPLHFIVLGTLFAIFGYLILEFSRSYLLQILNRTFITRRLVFTLTLLLVLLLTAKWSI